MPRTPQVIDARRSQLRAATAILHRALRAEGEVPLDRAAKGYGAALCEWRKAILASAGVRGAAIEPRRAPRRTPIFRAA